MNLSTFSRAPRRTAALLFGFSLLLAGCTESKKPEGQAKDVAQSSASSEEKTAAPKEGKEEKDKGESGAAKAAAKIISDLPEKKLVDPVVNPKNQAPYTGPTGTLRGVVRASGDRAPELSKVLAKMEPSCDRSRSVYGVLFREGPNRELADVLVAVTKYEGYVPPKDVEVKVWGKGCAWDKRTYAMTYGQRLEIHGVDNRPYVPELLGQPMPAQLFVLPTAPPVQIAPKKPGRFQLVDSMRLYSIAEVYVLPYSTADVTELDGVFEISGIPVGNAGEAQVQVNALLPQTGATVGKTVIIKAGETATVDFELPFDQKEYDKLPKPTPLDELPGPDE